jgi:hypothetical protein
MGHRLSHRAATVVAALLLAGLTAAPVSAATVIDITTGAMRANVNGAWFIGWNPGPSTGTGLFNPFLSIQSPGNAGIEHGYNHSLPHTPHLVPVFDEYLAGRTRALPVADIPVVTLEGETYREFLLDAGEPSAHQKKNLEIEKLQVFLTTTPNVLTTVFNHGILQFPGQLIYNLDAAGLEEDCDGWGRDITVLLDGSLSSGNGSPDMKFLLPNHLFSNVDAATYVVFYTKFGKADGTFSEWGVGPAGGSGSSNSSSSSSGGGATPWPSPHPGSGDPTVTAAVPEPGSVVLLLGAMYLTSGIRRQNRGISN